MATLGFDSSVLSPFARARRLETLEQLTSGHHRVVTRAVLEELDHGVAKYPLLADVRALRWLELVAIDSFEELVAFSDFVKVLGSGPRNIGEASILAWALHQGGVALIDDQSAVNAGKDKDVEVRRSLGLVSDGLHRKTITIDAARNLIDELVTIGGARFPCDGAGFETWAEANGLLVRT